MKNPEKDGPVPAIMPASSLFWVDYRYADKPQLIADLKRDGTLWMNPRASLAQRRAALMVIASEYSNLNLAVNGSFDCKVNDCMFISQEGARWDPHATRQDKTEALAQFGQSFVRLHRLAHEVDRDVSRHSAGRAGIGSGFEMEDE